ncbi:MAG: AhpC/TSA family protein [Rikenellaceae bacterium]|nr:AhpC/TSA family protein [Rikenellaceae bacterium]MCL2692743.1 AhpC/TSA family protein [Rikenellaceae bacterium]
MKNILIIAVAALTFFACKQQETTFTITGTVANHEMEGAQVRMIQFIDGQMLTMDSALIVDGTYTFTGSVKAPTNVRLNLADPRTGRMSSPLHHNVILENARINITTDAEGDSRVSGTKNNDILQAFLDAELILQRKRRASSSEEESRKYVDELQELRIEFAKNNINNPAGQSQLNNLRSSLPIEQLKEIIAHATPATLRVPEVVRIVDYVQAIEQTAIGQRFVDLRMPDVNGKEIAISDFAGKGDYVLLDFTAVWCGPCRAQKPDMIATYNRFKDKGFNIVGIWFDRDHETWANGMKELNMPDWPQMSDLKYIRSEGAIRYNVSSLPHSVLLDPNGIIIAKNIKGEELDEKLERLLGR